MRKVVVASILCGMLFMAMGAIAQDEALPPFDHEVAGVTVLVPDTVICKSTVDMGKYWEPFTDIFGDGTIAIIAGAYPEGQTSGYNSKIALVDMDGNVVEYWAFYGDDGEPYTGEFNEARKDGNPPRIACDRRPGGTVYCTGQESTPYLYDEFNSDDRWESAFEYLDKQVGAVQMFNMTADGPAPITNVIDPVYGGGDISGTQNNQMRFGGEIRVLSNGNVLVVVEDRNAAAFTAGTAAMATIFDGETGEIVKGPFNGAGDDSTHSIWSNVAAFNGGFAIRTEAVMTIWDNDGNMKFVVDQADWTTVADTGRGDGTRIASHINSDYIYILGKEEVYGDMVVATFNAQTGEPGTEVTVNELEMWDYGTFDRGDLAVDPNGNICLAYEVEADGIEAQTCARILDSDFEPVTPTFFAFSNFDSIDNENQGFLSKEINVSMDGQRIVISADGVNLDESGEITPAEHAFFTVLENPFKEEAVSEWALY